MTLDAGVALTAIGGLVGGLVWLIRLEGRVNMHEDRHASLKANHDKLTDDVQYIRKRIDEALNGRH